MHVETKHGHRLFSFCNERGEVEISIQKIAGAGIVWYGVFSAAEAMQFAQQIEEAAIIAKGCEHRDETFGAPEAT